MNKKKISDIIVLRNFFSNIRGCFDNLSVKKKKFKLTAERVKSGLKSSQAFFKKILNALVSHQYYLELKAQPLHSTIFRKILPQQFILIIFGLINAKTMQHIESIVPFVGTANIDPLLSLFQQSSWARKITYSLCVVIKTGFIINSCNSLRDSLQLPKQKFLEDIELKHPIKDIVLNSLYIASIELKMFDFIYFFLTISYGIHFCQKLSLARSLRKVDFVILVGTICVQISFTILDSINSNPSKK